MLLVDSSRIRGPSLLHDSIRNMIMIDSDTSKSVDITRALTQHRSMAPLLKMTMRSDLLDIIRRHALRHTPLFDIRPSISGVFTYKHKPLSFSHAPLRIAS